MSGKSVSEAELRRLKKISEQRTEIARGITEAAMRNGQKPQELFEKVLEVAPNCNIHPVWPMLLVEPLDMQEISDSTKAPGAVIELPNNAPCRWREGIIIEVPSCLGADFKPMPWPGVYGVGDRILFNPFVGVPIVKTGKNLELIPHNQIVAFTREETQQPAEQKVD